MNYLQYISTIPHFNLPCASLRFLVSGVDASVRQIVGQDIVSSCSSHGKTLFIVDNTQENRNFQGWFGQYRIVDISKEEVCLCPKLLEVSSLQEISRFRALLACLGFDGTRTMQVVSYLSFVKETERRLGNKNSLTVDILEDYGSPMLVQWKLRQLVSNGTIDETHYNYLLGKYSEVSHAAADFEMFFTLLAPFLRGVAPSGNVAIRIPVGDFSEDRPLQDLMSKLMLDYVRQNTDGSVVFILDNGRGGDRGVLIDILKNLPSGVGVHMFSNDAFSFDSASLQVIMNIFPIRIYTRHIDMESAQKIESRCGEIDVVRRTTSVTIDKRIRATSAWDILFGTNRTETETRNAPTKEYRFRKEAINTLSGGTGIVDCAGNQILFYFHR